MTTYAVTLKTTNVEVCRYDADAPVEWSGMEFVTHSHTPLAEPGVVEAVVVPEEWFINVGPFFDRFGAYKLPILASADAYVQAVIKDSSVRMYIDLKGRRGELVQVIGLLQSKGFAVTTASVLDVKPTAGEVYRG